VAREKERCCALSFVKAAKRENRNSATIRKQDYILDTT
jgi:hypothetical protein